MKWIHAVRPAVLLAVLAIVLAGCKDKTLTPFQPDVENNPANFQFQVSRIEGVTTILNYIWDNDAEAANINQACAITNGDGTLTLLDADQQEVYSRDLRANGTFASFNGVPGQWTIRVTLKNVAGTVKFGVQTP